VFAADAQVSAAESAAHDRTASLRLESARLDVDTALKNNEIRANYALKKIDQAIETNRAKATVLAQLAAATLSGVNFGSSYSGSDSFGRSYSVSYSGEATDAPYIPVATS
jgi:hypothetical protein